MNGMSVVYLKGFTDSVYTVYTGDKPKPNVTVNSDAHIIPLPCWLLSLAWNPIKDKHLDLFLKLWLFQHPKQVSRPLGGARPKQLQRDAGVAEVARTRAASAAGTSGTLVHPNSYMNS